MVLEVACGDIGACTHKNNTGPTGKKVVSSCICQEASSAPYAHKLVLHDPIRVHDNVWRRLEVRVVR